jgi:anti-sigma-K factor RskA
VKDGHEANAVSHDELDALAAMYAVGALDGADLARFQAHLATGCARCAALVPDAGAPTPARPSRAVHAGPHAAPGRVRGGWLRWAAVSVVAVVAAAGLTGMYVASRYEARMGHMVRDSLAQREGLHDLLRDPATRVIDLQGLQRAPASGRALWNRAKGGLIVVSSLPPATGGKAYAAWTISGGTPRPAGLFQVDARGRAAHRVAATGGDVDAFAVTLEPAAGAPAPTGPMVLSSK